MARGFIYGQGIYLWRGDLSPLDCAAVPFFSRAASRPSGDKSPRHSPLPQVFVPCLVISAS
ncbi:hypothetical protein DM828_24380 [Pseudomonas umsongensis]|nr:hypothetical protein [Pseudomonas umsongensis]